MEATITPAANTRPTTASAAGKKVWAGRILTAIIVLFLVVDGMGKVMRLAPYVEGTARVGYPDASIVPLGLVLLACTLLYAAPRTAVLGAILLTGYLGGATATHVRMGEPFVFPVVFGILTWTALYLRDASLRAFLNCRHA
jgi:hypothetical protein